MMATAKKVLFSVISTLILVGLLECAALFVEWLRPDAQQRRLRLPPKEQGTVRVFTYGESTVYGWPIPEWGFVAQMEYGLKRRLPERGIEVVNFGTPSIDSGTVRAMIRGTLRCKPDLLIVLTGHNEFLSDANPTLLHSIMVKSAFRRLLLRGLRRVRPVPPRGPAAIMPEEIRAYDRNADLFQRKTQTFCRNIDAIIDLAQRTKTPLILMTAPANLCDWPPVYQKLARPRDEGAYERCVREAKLHVDAGIFDKAALEIKRGLVTYADDPMLLFLQAKVLAGGGDMRGAKELFLQAKDRDPVPWRVLSMFNRYVRAKSDCAGVEVLDMERAFEAAADNGLVGFSLFCDNCHPTPRGNAIIAAAIGNSASVKQLLGTERLVPQSLDEQTEEFLAGCETPEDRARLQKKYLMNNAKYAMLPPFFNFDAASMYYGRAAELDDRDWRIWANMATMSLLENHLEKGAQELAKATELHGSPLDPDDRMATPYLKEALARGAASH